jgi:hypothetical protein
VRLSFDQPLPKGKPFTVTFSYDGHLTGNEDSPVFGIKFAAIHDEYAFLMYPARWFPVNGYTTARFSAEMNITVPSGYKVLAPGIEATQPAGDKVVSNFKFDHPSFPGSIAVVKDAPVRVNSEGVTTTLYFRDTEKTMAQTYGEEFGKQIFFSGLLGVPQYANLVVVETTALPTVMPRRPDFPEPARHWQIGEQQAAFEPDLAPVVRSLVSPATRNHLWLTNGFSTYAEMLWAEHTAGAGALETQFQNVSVEALTVDNVPIMQASRLEDYSPELWALTGSKGAAVLGMLRFVIGDEKFFATLKEYVRRDAWKAVITDDFKNVAQDVSKQDLGYFFIEWIESSGAPEFKLEYTIFRTQKARVMGKVAQIGHVPCRWI